MPERRVPQGEIGAKVRRLSLKLEGRLARRDFWGGELDLQASQTTRVGEETRPG